MLNYIIKTFLLSSRVLYGSEPTTKFDSSMSKQQRIKKSNFSVSSSRTLYIVENAVSKNLG